MAYGLKYELYCTTQKGNLYKAKIYFDGYEGSDIDRNIPINPFILKKDRSSVIRGTSFDFSMREETDFEFLDFYTNIPKFIKVELLNPSDAVIWTGFVDPQQYSCPYKPAPLSITFTASDGLGLLKSEDFTLTGRNSQLTIIRHCLDKIGLGLDFAIAISIHETRHNAGYSPIAQTFEDSETFAKLNCYEVIEKILGKYDAEITQWRGRWRIISSIDKKTTRLLYNSSGTYTGTEAAPAVLDMGFPGVSGVEVSPVGTLNFSLEPGGRQVHLTHDYGRKDSLLENYEFKKYASPNFDSWTQSGSFAVTQGDLNGIKFAFLETYSETNSDGILQEIPFDNTGGENFVFELDYTAVGYLMYLYKRVIGLTVRFMVALGDGETNYFLKDLGNGVGEWSTELYTINKTDYASVDVPQFKHIKITTPAPPVSGIIQVTLLRYYGTPPGSNYHYLGVCFSKPTINLIGGNADAAGGKYEATAVFDNSTEPVKLSDISILNADSPADVYNGAILYKNITRLSDDSITELWNIDGVSTDYTAIEILFKLLASRNRRSRQLLSGVVKGTAIEFDSIFYHAYNSNREFEIVECSWDIYAERFNGKFLEILAWSNETVTITMGEVASTPGPSSSGGGISSGGGTSEMTPSQILAALLKVDGSLCGLDADLLDGLHASAFALQGHTHPQFINNAFREVDFIDPLYLDASVYKDFRCSEVTDDTTLFLNGTSDGDAGMVEIIYDGVGGYGFAFASMFTKKLGDNDIVTDPYTDNVISWRRIGDDIAYTIAQIV
jgi:hypothetical protein